MEYMVKAGKKYKDGFKNICAARRYAYNTISKNGKMEIIRIANYGEEYIWGYVNRLGNTIFYQEWPSKNEWVLKKDGTLGEKYKW